MTRVNALLLCVLVACALSLVTSRHQWRRAVGDVERAREQARQYEVEYGQLSLEQSTWAMPARVEKIARESLHMQMPLPSRVQVVESASSKCADEKPCERPAAAVVANGTTR